MSFSINVDRLSVRNCGTLPLSTLRSKRSVAHAVTPLIGCVFGVVTMGCDGVLHLERENAQGLGGTTVRDDAQGGNAAGRAPMGDQGGTGGMISLTRASASTVRNGEGGQSMIVESETSGVLATGGASNMATGGTIDGTTMGTGGTAPIGRKGMTWGKLARFYLAKLEWLGCNGEPLVNGTEYCDTRVGDTPCSFARPILCLEDVRSPRPGYTVPETPPGDMNDEYYAGWSGGRVATTTTVIGSSLTSRARADEICRESFGTSWRMAEFHDGWWISGMSSEKYAGSSWDYTLAIRGGWSFFAKDDTPITEVSRYWVAINDQLANCWDAP